MAFNGISSGIKKFINRKELIIAVVVVFLGVALLSYSGSKSYSMDGLQDGNYQSQPESSSYSDSTNSLAKKQPTVAETHAQYMPPQQSGDYGMRPVNNAAELLPSDPNSEWAQLNPALNAGATPDLLSPGQYIGISRNPLRNANLQFRSDPVISKQDVGPWNLSTIDQDISRIPLEIGYSGCQ
jgi:hypothetical protein